jgi:hypothetical protein
MDHQRVDAWLDGYRRAWEQADIPAVLGLFTTDAGYRSHPPRPAHTGHDGIGAYWDRATADQQDVRVRFGDPIVDGDRVAVEWWTTTLEDGHPATLIGASFLTFTPDGLVATGRDDWFLEPGTHRPFDGWGR